SSSSIKEALTFLVQHKPSFVMVAVDHPNNKIRALPRVLAQAFPCCVIGFCESSSTASYKLLVESGIKYKVNPPATGPAVERAVNKFLKDQEAAREAAAREAAARGPASVDPQNTGGGLN